MAVPQSADWDEIDLALGRLARAWSQVEMLLRELMENLANMDPFTGALIHYKMSASTLIKHCHALAGGFKDDAEVKRVRDWLDRADKLRETRNDFIHGTWAFIGSNDAGWKTGLLMSIPRPKAGVVEQKRTSVTGAAVDGVKEDVLQLCRDFGQIPIREGHRPTVSFLPNPGPSSTG